MTDTLGADGKPLYRVKNRPAPPQKPPEPAPEPTLSKLEIMDVEAWLANPLTEGYFAGITKEIEGMKAEAAEKSVTLSYLESPSFTIEAIKNAAAIDALSFVVKNAKEILFNQRRESHGRQPD